MTARVKIGLIGTGEIGRVHAQAHSRVEGTELCIAGLLQPDAERQVAELYGGRRYDSCDALLADDSGRFVSHRF